MIPATSPDFFGVTAGSAPLIFAAATLADKYQRASELGNKEPAALLRSGGTPSEARHGPHSGSNHRRRPIGTSAVATAAPTRRRQRHPRTPESRVCRRAHPRRRPGAGDGGLARAGERRRADADA